VGLRAGLDAEARRKIFPVGARIFLFTTMTALASTGYRRLLPQEQCSWVFKFTTHIHLVSILKMHGTVPLICSSSWCSAHGGDDKFFVGKSEGKKPLGKPKRRWEDNIIMDLWEIGFWNVDWIHVAQDMADGGLL
jgi:hypothetical protein